MSRSIRASAPKAAPPPGPVAVRHDPTLPGRRLAAQRTQVPTYLPALPPRRQWPARLRGCGEHAVQIALAMADGHWGRLHVEGGGVTVR